MGNTEFKVFVFIDKAPGGRVFLRKAQMFVRISEKSDFLFTLHNANWKITSALTEELHVILTSRTLEMIEIMSEVRENQDVILARLKF